MASINPNFLKSEELSYEISVRGLAVPSSYDDKRKALRGLLKQQESQRATTKIKNSRTFEVDEKEFLASLKDIENKIKGLPTCNKPDEYARIACRLCHLAGRLNLMNVEEANKSNFDALRLSLLYAENDLADVAESLPSRPDLHNSLSLGQAPITDPVQIKEEHCVGKVVPVYKWGIQKFSGKDPKELMHFLEIIESLRKSRRCTYRDLFASAGDLFEGDAWTWWHNSMLKNRFSDWNDLVSKLKDTFLPEKYDENLLTEIRSRKQLSNEQVTAFISSMEAMFYRLVKVPLESEIVSIIKANLLPDYVKLLALQNVGSISDLVGFCRRIESSLRDATRPESMPLEKVRSRFQNCSLGSKTTCWNCNRVGHRYQTCFRKKTLFCHGCGRKGISQVNCNKCSRNSSGTRAGNFPEAASSRDKR